MRRQKTTALFLLIILCISVFVGCAAREIPASEPPSAPPETEKPSSGTNLTQPDTPNPEESFTWPWPEPVYGEEKDFTIEIEGMEETVTMTYMVVDFSWGSGPSVAMYVDRERYVCSSFEGEYDIFTYGDVEGEHPNNIHYFPYYGKTAQEYFDELKGRTADWGNQITDEGTVELDNHTALYFSFEGGSCYFIDYSEGCVFLGLSYEPEAAEGHGVRLMEILKTVQIIE